MEEEEDRQVVDVHKKELHSEHKEISDWTRILFIFFYYFFWTH